MGLYKTKYCFFTGEAVYSCVEQDGTFLDGYYYQFNYDGKIRDIRLSPYDDWQNDIWIKAFGKDFLNLIDKYDKWDFFNFGRSINQIRILYSELKEL